MVLGAHGKGIAVVALAGLGVLSLLLALLGPFSGFDFENAYMGAARAVADGHSPYPPTGAWEIAHDRAYVYPPTLAVLLAPLTFVPIALATHIATLFCVAAVGASLWLAGVRDARVYFIVYLWAPVFAGIQNLNASLARDAPRRPGLALSGSMRSLPGSLPASRSRSSSSSGRS